MAPNAPAPSVEATSASTPPGWYPDPWGQHERRYWDGTDWTGRIEDDRAAPAVSPQGSKPVAILIAVASAAAIAVAALSFGKGREKLALLAVALVLPLAASNVITLARGAPERSRRSVLTVVTAWVVVAAVFAVGGYRGFQGTGSCASRLGPNASLARCAFAGRDLTKFDLHGADLSGANLTDVDLDHVNLVGANLTDAILTNANLTATRLDGAVLHGATLDGTVLNTASLAKANLTNTKLHRVSAIGAAMPDADLTGAELTATNLTGTGLDRAVLHGVTLDTATIDSASFASANLTGAKLVEVSGVNVVLSNADLSGAQLTSTDLSGAFLDGTNLKGAVLQDTNLGSTTLTHANFADATLTNVVFDHADLVDAAGLTDQSLAGAFAIAPADVAKTLSDRGLFLESEAATVTAAGAACAGTPVAGAGATSSNGSFVVIVNQGSMVITWPTHSPALRFVELVACVGATTTTDVDECGPYVYADGSPAHGITRYREGVTVTLLNPGTGAVVATRTIDGPEPDGCPLSSPDTVYRMGSSIDVDTVQAAVTEMVTAAGV